MFIIKEGTQADKVGEGTDEATKKSISDWLEKSGYSVRTAEQEKTFREMMANQDINKALNESYTKFEATILETTGITKGASEKFHDYHKRAMGEKLQSVKDLEAKVKQYEDKGVDSSEMLKQAKIDLEAARTQISTLNKEWETKLQEKDTEVFKTRIDSEIEKEVAKIRATIDPTIRPELVDDIIQSRLDRFRKENEAANSEGMIVFKDPTTKVTKFGKKDGKPEALGELLPKYFEGVIDPKRIQGGGGSGEPPKPGDPNPPKPPAKWKEIALPETIKSQVQLTEYLSKEAKLDASTKEYSEAFEGLKGDLPIR